MRRGAALIACIALVLALPAGSAAHTLVRVSGGELSSVSADATSLNTLTARVSGGEVELRDPTVDGGMDPGPCRPGELTNDANSWVIQVFCPIGGITRLRISLGDREDSADLSSLPLPATLSGGFGTDTLTSGGGADVLSGDDGNDTVSGGGGNDQAGGGDGNDLVSGDGGDDVLQAGLGLDRLDGGDGSDDLRSRDGLTDVVGCGAGFDRVDADTVDEIAADCESVTRTLTAPPPGDWSSGDDRLKPRLRVGGPTLQRLGRRGRIRIAASSSERGTIAASGFLDVAGLSLPLISNRRRVTVAGGGVTLTVKLKRRELRAARRALRARRRVVARLTAVATDRAGNSAKRRMPLIRLRR
jgi:RTX calcium-binding nonapeptide repeat (4 copies)